MSRVTLKVNSTTEENVSRRTQSFEVHIDGKYLTHFADKLDALEKIDALRLLTDAELDATERFHDRT